MLSDIARPERRTHGCGVDELLGSGVRCGCDGRIPALRRLGTEVLVPPHPCDGAARGDLDLLRDLRRNTSALPVEQSLDLDPVELVLFAERRHAPVLLN